MGDIYMHHVPWSHHHQLNYGMITALILDQQAEEKRNEGQDYEASIISSDAEDVWAAVEEEIRNRDRKYYLN